MDMVNVASHVEIDVRRPNGTVETIIPPHPLRPSERRTMLTEQEFRTIKAATAAAGRGEVLAYRNVTKAVEAPVPSAADLADLEYVRRTNAILRAGAGGEPCDQIGSDIDHTPAHPAD